MGNEQDRKQCRRDESLRRPNHAQSAAPAGWITMLRSLEPGLEVRRGRQWLPIVPRPDAFVMNFGCAIEILTRDTRMPVAAVAHRVVEQQVRPKGVPDRFSYAMFVDSSLDTRKCEGLYRFDPEDGLVLATDFNAFLERILTNTYDRDAEGLY
ncbi:MAG: 2OG-Fe(II) oxygenase family protein [Janthinobacterium lividum]